NPGGGFAPLPDLPPKARLRGQSPRSNVDDLDARGSSAAIHARVPCSFCAPAAVYYQGVAGDVAGFVRGQKADCSTDVLCCPATGDGNDLARLVVVDRDPAPAHVGDVGGEELLRMLTQVRQDRSWAHGVDRHPPRGVDDGHLAREPDHTMLGGNVRGAPA